MTKLSFVLFSERAIRDDATKMWSYINVFHTVTIGENKEFLIADFTVSGVLTDTPSGTNEVLVEIITPSGSVLSQAGASGELSGGLTDINLGFNGVRFSEAGKHHLRVTVNGTKFEEKDKFFVTVYK